MTATSACVRKTPILYTVTGLPPNIQVRETTCFSTTMLVSLAIS